MRRILAMFAVVGLLFALVAVAPVSAGTRTDVTMDVTTIFDDNPDAFTATVPNCASGVVFTGGKAEFPPPFGNFLGYKFFDCGNDTGFAVRLNAHFSYDGSGSIGTWAVVDAWGALAGMAGAGKLIGESVDETTIIDHYFGTVTL